jgi:putative transposase
VLLDLFSRFVVGWMLARHESGALARRLIAESCERQGIEPGQLTIHADRGSAPASKTVAQLLADLGVERSHSRPHVSNDNPFSESQFATVKGHPEFPDRFASFEHAHDFCRNFFPWYNTEHRHSGIAYLTPEIVHTGQASRVIAQRAKVLDAAYAAHPERFVRRPPTPPALPEAGGSTRRVKRRSRLPQNRRSRPDPRSRHPLGRGSGRDSQLSTRRSEP